MIRNKRVERTPNDVNEKPPRNTFLREGVLGPIRWVDQNLLKLGSNANASRAYRPVTVAKINDIYTYVLPMTTVSGEDKFRIEKDSPYLKYLKKHTKTSYIKPCIESLVKREREEIGSIFAYFKSGEGDLRPQIAKWYSQRKHVLNVKILKRST